MWVGFSEFFFYLPSLIGFGRASGSAGVSLNKSTFLVTITFVGVALSLFCLLCLTHFVTRLEQTLHKCSNCYISVVFNGSSIDYVLYTTRYSFFAGSK